MAIQVGIGVSQKKDTLQAAQEAIKLARLNLRSEKIGLALVFGSVDFSHQNILKLISGMLGDAPVVGCSSLALISNQGVFKYGILIALLGLPESIYLNTSFIKDIGSKSTHLAGEELGGKLLYGFKDIRRDLSIIFSDGLIGDASDFLWGLQEKLGRSFPLAGASSSDNLAFKKTYQYYKDEVFSDGACGILWGGKLNFGLGIKHGWRPLGKPRYVTKSNGNIIYEIDGKPAVTIYKEYLAADLSLLRRELKRISILYPLGIYLPGEEEYILRNIFSIETDGALVFHGNIPEGSLIRLMIGTKESCLGATQDAADEAKKGLAGKQANFVLVFNSVSRYILLGRQVNKELEIIKERFGEETPIAGIYTYGEQAPLKAIDYHGRAYFHNQSIEILAIGG